MWTKLFLMKVFPLVREQYQKGADLKKINHEISSNTLGSFVVTRYA